VMTSIALAMVVTGLVTLDQGIFLTMGSNIGSCVVAILAGMTSGLNARRTAMIHLLFNCFGVFLFLLVSLVVRFGDLFSIWFPNAPQTQLAMFHTFFNTATVLVMLPLTRPLVNFVCKILPEEAKTVESPRMYLHFVNENVFRTPAVAVGLVRREILRMADLAKENVDRSLDIITRLDFTEHERFERTEEELDYLNNALVEYVVRLSEQVGLNDRDHIYLSTTYRSVRDLERIGDYAENIVEYAEALRESGQRFSDDALYEISQLKALFHQLYYQAMRAYDKQDFSALEEANVIEEQTDEYARMMEDNHIKRLESGVCTPVVGAQYLSLSSNVERIADHLINVAKTIRSLRS